MRAFPPARPSEPEPAPARHTGEVSLKIIVTSPRVAPGLMTLAAWDALREADRVLCADPGDPTVHAVRQSGIEVAAGDQHEARSADHGSVVWIAPTGDVAWASTLAGDLVDGGATAGDIEIVFASYDLPGSRLLDLVDVMDRLRRECPWTAQQTHASLTRYLLEETYEVLEALDRADGDHLREELGDLLMQVVFHARIAADDESEGEGWTIDDVAGGIVEKLIRRNPHVFADTAISTAEDVDANWQAIKATEKQRGSLLEGIPEALPALAYADKVLERIERRGQIDLVAPGGQDDFGARLLLLVREARSVGVDPEQALRVTIAESLA